MGCTFSIILYGCDFSDMEAAVEAAFCELHRLDRMLSNYQPGSEWSRMNLHAASGPVTVSAELFQLLLECEKYCEQSQGAFDITIGPLMKAWGFYKGTGRVPSPAEVANALAHCGPSRVRLGHKERTVQFDQADVELDPGGIGKGYAIDRMTDILRSRGFTSALIAGSRSSIYGLGTPPAEPQGWRVSISDARDPRKCLTKVRLKNMSLSTSGSFEKFFLADGWTYSHMIDPRTGYPARSTALVSVMAPRTVDSEVWTKPCFIHGPAWAAERKPEGFRVFICENPSAPGIWI